MGLNKAQQAKELVKKFWESTASIDVSKKCAIVCVETLLEAIKITTGHCTLRSLDFQEVQMDLNYWEGVIAEIKNI